MLQPGPFQRLTERAMEGGEEGEGGGEGGLPLQFDCSDVSTTSLHSGPSSVNFGSAATETDGDEASQSVTPPSEPG